MLLKKLVDIISDSCLTNSRVRLITLDLTCQLLELLVTDKVVNAANSTTGEEQLEGGCFLDDESFARIVSAQEEITLLLRNYFKVIDWINYLVQFLFLLMSGGFFVIIF